MTNNNYGLRGTLVGGNGESQPPAEATAIAGGLVNLILQATEGNFQTVAGKAEYAAVLCNIVPLIVDAIVVGINKERDGQATIITDAKWPPP